jgi:hypothetical protein
MIYEIRLLYDYSDFGEWQTFFKIGTVPGQFTGRKREGSLGC